MSKQSTRSSESVNRCLIDFQRELARSTTQSSLVTGNSVQCHPAGLARGPVALPRQPEAHARHRRHWRPADHRKDTSAPRKLHCCQSSISRQPGVGRGYFEYFLAICVIACYSNVFAKYNLKMLSRRFGLIVYLVFGLLWSFSLRAQISKGHQILINRGLQLQGLVAPDNWFHPDTYSNANFTTVGFSWNSTGNLGPPSTFLGPPPGSPSGRCVCHETNMPGMGYCQTGNSATFSRTNEIPYLSQLVGIQLGDEWNLDDAATRTRLVNWFNAVRSNWPNAI